MPIIKILKKKQFKLLPFLYLPIGLSDQVHGWYCDQEKDLKIITKYFLHFLSNVFFLLLLPLSFIVDVMIGSIAFLMLPFSLERRVLLKQIAWNCLICGFFGPLTALFQLTRRMFFPQKF